MFAGSTVALVTPFKEDRIDFAALEKLIDWHVEAGTDYLLVCGTTGESPTLTHAEHKSLIKEAVRLAAGRRPVIAGTGSNNTKEALDLTAAAAAAGAAGALLITPYYNKPVPEGLYRHFAAVAQAVDLPLILYNVPSRTGVNLLPETAARLAEFANVVAVKEASGSLDQASAIQQLAPRLTVLSGDDSLTLPLVASGGEGVISVAANVVPGEMRELVQAARAGNRERAVELHRRLWPLFKILFVETNPIPVKAALALMGRIGPELRSPLTPLGEANRDRLAQVLADLRLI